MELFSILIRHKNESLAILLSGILYWYIGYHIKQSDFLSIVVTYSALFLFFIYITKQQISWYALITISICFRLIFFFSSPTLSQDFYRFVWDGRMLLNGINPYLFLPEDFLSGNYIPPNEASILVSGMKELNASHYSNYPPLNQFCFAVSSLFSPNSIIGNIIVMRIIIILSDIGVFYFGRKLLKILNLNSKGIFLYILNPLIIIEFTGNLHFEGVMIFFLLWGLYLFQQNKWQASAVVFSWSISLKLLPLLFLPLFFKRLSFKKLIVFYILIGLCVLLFFVPFLTENLIHNYSKTIRLWFGTFEFNGSLYLLARAIGYQITGYNTIAIIGKITPIVVLLFVIGISLFKKDVRFKGFIFSMLIVLTCYLFTSSTVHPWYIGMLLILGILSNYKFPLLWSFVIILSYSIYDISALEYHYWLIFIEYSLVFGMFIYEIFINKKTSKDIEVYNKDIN